jgi:hypothetical protein
MGLLLGKLTRLGLVLLLDKLEGVILVSLFGKLAKFCNIFA